MWDCIIVGAGSAGLSAGIYASRRGMKTLIFSKEVGGQAALTDVIENYPGAGRVSGTSLINAFQKEAASFGCSFRHGEVVGISGDVERGFSVSCAGGEIERGKTIILAFGLTPRDLEVPGERKRGVYYSSVPDEERVSVRGKRCIVVGGGSTALDTAVGLSKICANVFVVHRRESFTAEQHLLARAESAHNISFLLQAKVREIVGDERVRGVVVEQEGNGRSVSAEAVVVCVGYRTHTRWLEGFVDRDERGFVVINAQNETSRPGVFAAGDVTTVPYKQVVVSAGEGAKAALRAHAFLQQKIGKPALVPDWGTIS